MEASAALIRAQLLSQLADLIVALKMLHPLRVAIDGVDAAGKTTLANELVAPVKAHGRQVIRASIDGFHRPRAERYQRGTDSPEGYYYDSFDYAALRAALLDPLGPNGNRAYRRAAFDFRTDTPVLEPTLHAPTDAVLLFEGVFLFRPELNDCWDYRIFVHVDFEVAVNRAARRDQALFGTDDEVRSRYWKRYVPGQHIYLQAVRPQTLADVVVENNDPAKPRLVLCDRPKTNHRA
jgi:uridine kinase